MKFTEALEADIDKQGIRRKLWNNENHRFVTNTNGYIFDEDNEKIIISKYDILETDDWELYEEAKPILNKPILNKPILNKTFSIQKKYSGALKIRDVCCCTPSNPEFIVQEIEKLLNKNKTITLKVVKVEE